MEEKKGRSFRRRFDKPPPLPKAPLAPSPGEYILRGRAKMLIFRTSGMRVWYQDHELIPQVAHVSTWDPSLACWR